MAINLKSGIKGDNMTIFVFRIHYNDKRRPTMSSIKAESRKQAWLILGNGKGMELDKIIAVEIADELPVETELVYVLH